MLRPLHYIAPDHAANFFRAEAYRVIGGIEISIQETAGPGSARFDLRDDHGRMRRCQRRRPQPSANFEVMVAPKRTRDPIDKPELAFDALRQMMKIRFHAI
jgi:hypothetical protein